MKRIFWTFFLCPLPLFIHHSDLRSEANYAPAFLYICASNPFVKIVIDVTKNALCGPHQLVITAFPPDLRRLRTRHTEGTIREVSPLFLCVHQPTLVKMSAVERKLPYYRPAVPPACSEIAPGGRSGAHVMSRDDPHPSVGSNQMNPRAL
jgi:hypothetical protein